ASSRWPRAAPASAPRCRSAIARIRQRWKGLPSPHPRRSAPGTPTTSPGRLSSPPSASRDLWLEGSGPESKPKSRSKSTSNPPAPGIEGRHRMFGHEKLDLYRLELEFLTWLTDLMAELKEAPGVTPEIRSQLDRASLSALLNTAEGNGK